MFGLAFDQLASARKRARFDHAREFPFDRIIVNTFADIFGLAQLNGSLSPLGDDTWELTEAGFYNFTAKLFSGLRIALADTADRAASAQYCSICELDALD